MEAVFLIGRILLGGYLIYNGANHFISLGTMAQYAAGKGIPMAEAAVLLAGVLLLVGGFSFLLGLWPRIGVLAMAIFFVTVTPLMHDFWTIQDPQARMGEMINFTKNFALLASALMFLAIPEPWPYSVRARLARRPALTPG